MVAARSFDSAGKYRADRGNHHSVVFRWDVRLCRAGICFAVSWVWGVNSGAALSAFKVYKAMGLEFNLIRL